MPRRPSRRQFLVGASTALAAPLVVPASVLGLDPARPAPSERIALACIGVGGRGTSDLNIFRGKMDAEIVAVCDVDRAHRERGLQEAGLPAAVGSGDFREVIARRDVDAVMVATPDHWHALIASAAVKAGKDVYCEKPLAASIAEGRALVKTVRKSDRVLQCGTQRRSMATVRFACELVRNGRIGRVKRVECGVPARFAVRGGFSGLEPEQPVPAGLDYRRWLGPCPDAPYTEARCHFNFRWVSTYAPGYITDWGAHYLDIAQWGLGEDESGPVSIEARDVHRREKGIYDAPEGFELVYTYGGGAQAVLVTTGDTAHFGMKFIGEKGSVYVEAQKVITEPESLASSKIAADETHLYDARNDHHGNFLDCVRSRKQPSAPVHIAHRSASVCHLGAIACRLGRHLKWNPDAERFVGDDEANEHITRPMRSPWGLELI